MALDDLFDDVDDYEFHSSDDSYYDDPDYIEWLKLAGADETTLRKQYLAKVVYPKLTKLHTKEEAKLIVKEMFKYYLIYGTFLGFIAPAV